MRRSKQKRLRKIRKCEKKIKTHFFCTRICLKCTVVQYGVHSALLNMRSIQDNFSFQPTGLVQNPYFESSPTNKPAIEFADRLLLASVDNFQYIPNAPTLLFPPAESRPVIPSDQLLSAPKTFGLGVTPRLDILGEPILSYNN